MNWGRRGQRHDLFAANLVAHDVDRADRRGPHEHDFGIGTGTGEVGVLGQESVAGMDGRGASAWRRNQCRYAEVAELAAAGPIRNGDIGHTRHGGVGIRVAVDRDRANTEAAQRLDDAAGDLPAICNQNRTKHGSHPKQPEGGFGSGVAAHNSEREAEDRAVSFGR